MFPSAHYYVVSFFTDFKCIAGRREAWKKFILQCVTLEQVQRLDKWWRRALSRLNRTERSRCDVIEDFHTKPIHRSLHLTLKECTPFEACIQLCTGGDSTAYAQFILAIVTILIYQDKGVVILKWIWWFVKENMPAHHWAFTTYRDSDRTANEFTWMIHQLLPRRIGSHTWCRYMEEMMPQYERRYPFQRSTEFMTAVKNVVLYTKDEVEYA